VDDELSIAKIGTRILEKLVYTVSTKTSSVEALEEFRSDPDRYDLVISDMTMPNLTADKLAAELIKIRSDIPIIILTGYSKKMSEELAARIGIKWLINKPVEMSELARAVRNVLDKEKKPR